MQLLCLKNPVSPGKANTHIFSSDRYLKRLKSDLFNWRKFSYIYYIIKPSNLCTSVRFEISDFILSIFTAILYGSAYVDMYVHVSLHFEGLRDNFCSALCVWYRYACKWIRHCPHDISNGIHTMEMIYRPQ